MVTAFHSTSALKKGWGPNKEDILFIPNWAEFMGSPAAAVPISPPGSFLHSWDSHSVAAQAHCASSHAILLSCRGTSRMWSHHSLHTHLAAVLVGCLGWGSLLDSWLLASLQGAYGNFHGDDPNCSYLAYQEAQAIGVNQFRKHPISDRKEILLFACRRYLLLQSL